MEHIFRCLTKKSTLLPAEGCHLEMDASPLIDLAGNQQFQFSFSFYFDFDFTVASISILVFYFILISF